MSLNSQMLPFGGHLDILRKMLFRILVVISICGVIIFYFKEWTFNLLLAPRNDSFVTFQWIHYISTNLGYPLPIIAHHIKLINTELSAQLMVHISISLYLSLLLSSPYIVYELFRFISPALYKSEKNMSVLILIFSYVLFLIGLIVNYFIIFPISFQFLSTYQVDKSVENTINLSSYISTFVNLSFAMGIIFLLPVISFFLAYLNIINKEILIRYRKHAFVVITIIAAIITPSTDIFTLAIVVLPMYLLYELSIWIVKNTSIRQI